MNSCKFCNCSSFCFFAWVATLPLLLPYSVFKGRKKRQNKVKIWRRTHSLVQKNVHEVKAKTAQPCGFEGSWTNERYSVGTLSTSVYGAHYGRGGRDHGRSIKSGMGFDELELNKKRILLIGNHRDHLRSTRFFVGKFVCVLQSAASLRFKIYREAA